MNTLMMTLRRVGVTLLMLAATIMIAVGFADAQQNPNKLCIAPSFSGCTPQDCETASGECNSVDWEGYERSAYPYRLCNGAAANCDNWSATHKTCESRYYLKDEDSLCAVKGCTLKTEISACAP